MKELNSPSLIKSPAEQLSYLAFSHPLRGLTSADEKPSEAPGFVRHHPSTGADRQGSFKQALAKPPLALKQ